MNSKMVGKYSLLMNGLMESASDQGTQYADAIRKGCLQLKLVLLPVSHLRFMLAIEVVVMTLDRF